MKASSNQPPPPSKQQQQLYETDNSAWLPKGPMCLTYLISLVFAVLTPIVFLSIGSSVSDDGWDGMILAGLPTSLCYLLSLVTGIIGRRRVKRDPDLKGNKFNSLFLTLLTIVYFFLTCFVLFIWVYIGDDLGGFECC